MKFHSSGFGSVRHCHEDDVLGGVVPGLCSGLIRRFGVRGLSVSLRVYPNMKYPPKTIVRILVTLPSKLETIFFVGSGMKTKSNSHNLETFHKVP